MSEDTRPDLRRATILGVRWMSSARLIAEIAALASMIVLARLIPPSEFGRAAVALIIAGVAVVLGPRGLTATLVQRPTLERHHSESAAFLCIASGVVLTAVTLLFARSAAESWFGDRTAELIALASPVWLLAGLGGVPQALLERELRFGRIALIESLPLVLAAGAAVGCAAAGLDGESLVVGALVLRGVSTAVALVLVPLVLPRPSKAGVADVAGFATPVTLSSMVYIGFRHVDYAILGARMPAADVGFYWRAYQLGVEYQGKISQIMVRVSFPVYSRADDIDELKRLRLRIVSTHATVIVPLLAVFIAVAPTLIPWLFGSAWEPAVVPAQIMAVAGMADAVMTGVGPLFVALGRPGLLLAWNIVELAVYAAMIALLAQYGLTWVSIGVAVYYVVSVFVIQTALMPRVIGLGLADFWRDVRAGVVTSAVVLPVLVAGRVLLEDLGAPTLLTLGVLALGGTAVYAASLRLLFRDNWADLVSIARRVGGRPAARV